MQTLLAPAAPSTAYQPSLFTYLSRLYDQPQYISPRVSTLRIVDANTPRLGRLFSIKQRANLKGLQPRKPHPKPNCHYLASIIAQDNSALATISEVSKGNCLIVHHLNLDNAPSASDLLDVIELLVNQWKCRIIGIDADGHINAFHLDLLSKTYEGRAIFVNASDPAIGDNLIEVISKGNVTMYAADGSEDYEQFWAQIVKAQAGFANGYVDYFIDRGTGNDSHLKGLALLTHAFKKLCSTRSIP